LEIGIWLPIDYAAWRAALEEELPHQGIGPRATLEKLAKVVIPHGVRIGAPGFSGWVNTTPTILPAVAAFSASLAGSSTELNGIFAIRPCYINPRLHKSTHHACGCRRPGRQRRTAGGADMARILPQTAVTIAPGDRWCTQCMRFLASSRPSSTPESSHVVAEDNTSDDLK
jgi:hypothetical protein